MAGTLPQTEGRIPFRGHSTWYTIVGEGEDPGKLPLVCLHGGPGGAHDYMESMGELGGTGRRVIFYDQLGCGRSPAPSNPEMWTVDLFLEELGVVRDALALDRIHLLGQSWGGMFGMESARTHPDGLEIPVVADSPGGSTQWGWETSVFGAELPAEAQKRL